MEMSYCGERLAERGSGFPFIYMADDPTTSIYKIIDLRFFVVDLLIYIVSTSLIVHIISSAIKKQILLKKRTIIVLSVMTAIVVLAIAIPVLCFSSFSEIDYKPVYESIKVNFVFGNGY
ncbi:hypothetical protein D0T60_15775 [Bacteroides sp. 224]|nr:hypothetical protein [Bacteroides sp. 224]